MKRSARILSLLMAVLMLSAMILEVTPVSAAFTKFYARAKVDRLRVRDAVGMDDDAMDHLDLNQLVWVIDETTAGGTLYFKIDFCNSRKLRDTGWVVAESSGKDYCVELTSSEKAKLSYKNGSLPNTKGSGGGTSGGGGTPTGVYKLGSKGETVRDIQSTLKSMKIYSGDITGNFGPKTGEAVRAFQRRNSLAVDGIAGPATLKKLFGGSGGSGGGGSGGGGSGGGSTNAGKYGVTTRDKVTLRASASTSSRDKSLLPKGTVFKISTTVYVGSYSWYSCRVEDGSGYIRSDMGRLLSAQETEDYLEDDTKPDDDDKNEGASGEATITANSVNIREDAGTEHDKVGTAQKGSVWTVLDSKRDSNGKTWYNISNGKLDGWVISTYVSFDGKGSGEEGSAYRVLKVGSTGEDVKQLQQALKDVDMYSATISGHYGEKTKAAVAAYQKKIGLPSDGIAGADTQAALFGELDYNLNTNGTPGGVELYDWWKFKSAKIYTKGYAAITDVKTKVVWRVKLQSDGNHLDVEPATKADTDAMLKVYGVSDPKKISYVRRAVWLFVANSGDVASTSNMGENGNPGRFFAASMYGVPHGDDTIANNGYDGQFCVHLWHSKTSGTDIEDKDHQAMVMYAYQHAPKKGKVTQ